MGPPNPYSYPRPHGIRHCQMKTPGLDGVLKLKVTTVWGPEVHGEVGHKLLFAWRLVGEAIGTLSPSPGIEKVCCTAHCAHEFSVETGFPLTYSTPPIVPWTWPQNWLRSGVQPSNPRIVTLTRVFAGTLKSVVWSQ